MILRVAYCERVAMTPKYATQGPGTVVRSVIILDDPHPLHSTHSLMLTAFVLLNVSRDKVNDVAEELVNMDGVAEVHSVAGRYDLVAIIRVHTNDHLAQLVTEHIRRVEGIEQSETLIGFQVYSHYDLSRLFSVGMD